MLWRQKNGIDVFTGVFVVYEPDTDTAWTRMGRPNAYKLKDSDDIDGERVLMTVGEFLDEMKQSIQNVQGGDGHFSRASSERFKMK